MTQAQVKEIAERKMADLNARGGINGRMVEPVYSPYNPVITAEAERLTADLSVLLGSDEVESFPAWETLPFERVSPGIETMGQRLRTLHRLSVPDRAPAIDTAHLDAAIALADYARRSAVYVFGWSTGNRRADQY